MWLGHGQLADHGRIRDSRSTSTRRVDGSRHGGGRRGHLISQDRRLKNLRLIDFGEKRSEYLPTEFEDSDQISSDEEGMEKASAGARIMNGVHDSRASADSLEEMFVMPGAVRASDLYVDESRGRIPNCDFTGPANGKPVDSQGVVDSSSNPHLNRSIRQHSKAQERGCDHIEIPGVCKEWKHLGRGCR